MDIYYKKKTKKNTMDNSDNNVIPIGLCASCIRGAICVKILFITNANGQLGGFTKVVDIYINCIGHLVNYVNCSQGLGLCK